MDEQCIRGDSILRSMFVYDLCEMEDFRRGEIEAEVELKEEMEMEMEEEKKENGMRYCMNGLSKYKVVARREAKRYDLLTSPNASFNYRLLQAFSAHDHFHAPHNRHFCVPLPFLNPFQRRIFSSHFLPYHSGIVIVTTILFSFLLPFPFHV